ncbi:unnamed protein product [Meloidogyne enterolobii]|uniref:Uncharacterized protein n=1 Tax=Meloidogyne enterolobii TaxID=390850 RepID=A0ACB0XKD7_MELEN
MVRLSQTILDSSNLNEVIVCDTLACSRYGEKIPRRRDWGGSPNKRGRLWIRVASGIKFVLYPEWSSVGLSGGTRFQMFSYRIQEIVH